MQSLQARSVTRCVTARRTSVVRAALPTTVARFGGGDVLDRPDVSIKRSGWDSDKDSNVATLPPRTETGGNDGSTNKQRGSVPGGGSWRVLLVDSPTHKERPVVQAITTVVSNADEAHARNCFATSKQLGVAIVVSCLKEIAEHYVQQLYMKGLKVTMEPDTAAI